MIVFGTGGHAIEFLEILENQGTKDLFFFNEIDQNLQEYYGWPVLNKPEQINLIEKKPFEFVIAVGKPGIREIKQNELIKLGGQPSSVISQSAKIGSHEVVLGRGLNIMDNVHISSRVQIGDGCLINRNVNIHHDVKIGDFCELAPNAILLGNVEINKLSFIGAGAIILPGVRIGENCVVGAGAVVTKDVPDFVTVKGNPAK